MISSLHNPQVRALRDVGAWLILCNTALPAFEYVLAVKDCTWARMGAGGRLLGPRAALGEAAG